MLCILLDFIIIWKLSTGILDALLMCLPLNCLVYVVYRLKGTMWVSSGVSNIVHFVGSCGSYVSENLYLSAGIICGLFISGTLYSFWVRYQRTFIRSEESLMIIGTNDRIGNVLIAIDTISTRLGELVVNVVNVVSAIDTIDKRLEEVNDRIGNVLSAVDTIKNRLQERNDRVVSSVYSAINNINNRLEEMEQQQKEVAILMKKLNKK